ncbi:hypothetical protein [Thiorhodococcus minor]|nr:hypothetical protein [Thiorhodococcus minor]
MRRGPPTATLGPPVCAMSNIAISIDDPKCFEAARAERRPDGEGGADCGSAAVSEQGRDMDQSERRTD